MDDAARSVALRAARLGPRADGVLERGGDRVGAWRRLLDAYDVQRQLERGYSLTYDTSGGLVRSTEALQTGAGLVTRFADGSARSTVDEVRTVPVGHASAAAGEERT